MSGNMQRPGPASPFTEMTTADQVRKLVSDVCKTQSGSIQKISSSKDCPLKEILNAFLRSLAEHSDAFSKANKNKPWCQWFPTVCNELHDDWTKVFVNSKIKSAFEMIHNNSPTDAIIELIKREEIDVNVPHPNPNERRTLLGMAVELGRTQIAKYLITKGANCNQKAGRFGSPVHAACALGNLELIKFMIESGNGDVKLKSETGVTPMHFACADGNNYELVKYLIEKEVRLDEKDDFHQQTPLHLACERANTGVASLLIQYNAKLHAEDRNGKTPFLILCSNKDPTGHGRSVQIAQAMYLKDPKVIEIRDKEGNSCLHAACKSGNANMAQTLIGYGCPVNAKGNRDESPMWSLITSTSDKAFNQVEATLQVLLGAHAELNAASDDGSTLLHFAVRDGNPKLAAFLVNQGIDTTKVDVWKQTAEQLAVSMKNETLVNSIRNPKQMELVPYHQGEQNQNGYVVPNDINYHITAYTTSRPSDPRKRHQQQMPVEQHPNKVSRDSFARSSRGRGR